MGCVNVEVKIKSIKQISSTTHEQAQSLRQRDDRTKNSEKYLHRERHTTPQTAGSQKGKLPVFFISLMCQNSDSVDDKGYIIVLNNTHQQHMICHIPLSHQTSPGGHDHDLICRMNMLHILQKVNWGKKRKRGNSDTANNYAEISCFRGAHKFIWDGITA